MRVKSHQAWVNSYAGLYLAVERAIFWEGLLLGYERDSSTRVGRFFALSLKLLPLDPIITNIVLGKCANYLINHTI